MNMFSALWMKFVGMFREANLRPLDPVPVETPEEVGERMDDNVATILEDISKVKASTPHMETVSIDLECFKDTEKVASVAKAMAKAKIKRPKRQLTKNFHIDEFACNDGTAVPSEFYVNVLELAENLQELRDQIGKPIKIISGYRHPAYNKKIGGARKSQHMAAMAADIKVKGIGADKLAVIIEKAIAAGVMEKGGVGRYPAFTHYDIRGKNARWGGTRKKG